MSNEEFDNGVFQKDMPVWFRGEEHSLNAVDFLNRKLGLHVFGKKSNTKWVYHKDCEI